MAPGLAVACCAFALVACGSKSTSTPTPTPTPTPTTSASTGARNDLHCTPQADFDEAKCKASGEGCGYGPQLICRGMDVDDETKQRERAEYEAGTQPCQCICSIDIQRCSEVP